MIKRLSLAGLFVVGIVPAQSLPTCAGVDSAVQETQSNCVVTLNPGGQNVITFSFTNDPTFVNTPVSQSVNQYQTKLIAVTNGVAVFQQTYAVAFSDPSVQNAISQADEVLTSDGATFGSPVLTSTSATLQSSVLSYVPTSPTLDLSTLIGCTEGGIISTATCSGVSVTNTAEPATVTFGPATIMVGPNYSDQFFVLAGQEDSNQDHDFTYTVTQNAVTTNTYLTSQTYVIQGTGGVAYSPCDVNRDGKTNITDVQGMINEALGDSPPANDLNLDGVVNVVDIQIVMGAAINGVCLASASPPAGPTITAMVNAASFQSGPIAPGEVVVLLGSGLGSSGGVQVVFDGTPAPLTYVSPTEINCVVPYEVASKGRSQIQMRYRDRTSVPFSLDTAATNPGIFTADRSGNGWAAALNQDQSGNSPANPAARGSTVVLFMTGEGQTSPPGVTGKVTAVSGRTLQPVLPVAVLIGGQPASVVFYGEAPGVISGVMQLNVQIPSNIPSGEIPVSVSVGGNSSQSGVTVSVRE
jgi:uncharacterized protein (TIGR03437 family)